MFFYFFLKKETSPKFTKDNASTCFLLNNQFYQFYGSELIVSYNEEFLYYSVSMANPVHQFELVLLDSTT